MKKSLLLLAAGSLLSVASMVGCGGDSGISITVWGGELQASQDYLSKMATAFQEANPDTKFNFTIGAVSESKVKDEWVKDPENAADFAIAADDQLYSLAKAGYVQDITTFDSTIASDVASRNSAVSTSVCKYNGDLYAFPVSSSNGYFLYYDSRKLSATDVVSFDSLMTAIKNKSTTDGKTYKFGFPYDSGWYLDGWFRGAGMSVTKDDAGKNTCDWNRTTPAPTGLDVAGAFLKLSSGDYKDYWAQASDSNLMVATADGTDGQVIATINGTWSADTITANWGTGAAATIIPTYKIGTTDYHMKAVAGCKIGIVNSFSKNVKWATAFANFITSEANQVTRYDDLAEAPTNTTAVTKVDLTKNYAVAALAKQTGTYGFVQSVGDKFWDGSKALDIALNTGVNGDDKLYENGAVNTVNLQALLDTTTTAIDADVA